MENLSTRLLNYRQTHFNDYGRHMSQINMVQRFNEEGLGLTISLETYIKWERGTGQPNAENLPIIEKILNEK